MSDSIAPGERRELRSVVRGQFKVLRAQVKRREAELKAEIEAELLAKYREQDAAIPDAPCALVRRHTPDETGSDLRAYPMAVLSDWRLPTPGGGAR